MNRRSRRKEEEEKNLSRRRRKEFFFIFSNFYTRSFPLFNPCKAIENDFLVNDKDNEYTRKSLQEPRQRTYRIKHYFERGEKVHVDILIWITLSLNSIGRYISLNVKAFFYIRIHTDIVYNSHFSSTQKKWSISEKKIVTSRSFADEGDECSHF